MNDNAGSGGGGGGGGQEEREKAGWGEEGEDRSRESESPVNRTLSPQHGEARERRSQRKWLAETETNSKRGWGGVHL